MTHYFLNSLMYAGLATLGCLVSQSIVGYAFARLRFPGRGILFGLTVAMLMMPFVVTLIPRFLLFRNLHLTGTLWPLIIPWWFGGSPYGIFLMRQFFMSIPKEIDEAARVDGLGHWRTLWRILMPQATPVLVALGILQFVYFWNDLLGPLIYTDLDQWKPLSLGIFSRARTSFSMNYQLFFAIVFVMVLPLALMFLALQRKFQRGFLHSGLGGR
jgi:multiple sugar transport system permease protein